jgi:hypothetical protein
MDVERPRRTSPARGVALIATAVIIGLFVLRNGFDAPEGGDIVAEADDSTATTVAGGGAPPGGESPGTTAAPAVRPPAEVTVIVANTTTVSGAAGAMSDTLAGLSYQMAGPTDAQPELQNTQVLFVEGFQAEAAAVAAAMEAPPESVQPLTDPPPIDPAGAQVVVMLGADLATAG